MCSFKTGLWASPPNTNFYTVLSAEGRLSNWSKCVAWSALQVSEGLDFTDGFARAVLLLGIPYPYVKDPKVQLKKLYNDQRVALTRNGRFLTGDAWYSQQAFR